MYPYDVLSEPINVSFPFGSHLESTIYVHMLRHFLCYMTVHVLCCQYTSEVVVYFIGVYMHDSTKGNAISLILGIVNTGGGTRILCL